MKYDTIIRVPLVGRVVRRTRARVVVYWAVILSLFVLGYRMTVRPAVHTTDSTTFYQSNNATLGFQKIYVLHMPSRTERRLNMDALSAFHNLDFTYPRVFNKHDANTMAAANNYLINGTHLACYLSHLHVYKQMIEDNIETALILEDDVDMELDLMHRHTHIMQQVYERYGRDWDMLYLGHCTWDRNEPTRPTAHNVSLYEAEYPVCMHAYVVTRDCARRLAVVLEERLTSVGRDIDMVLAVGVQFGVSVVLGTSPPYIVQIGRRELVSDLTLLEDGDTAQSLTQSTLFHLNMRSTDPRTLPAYMVF